jgi:hypothetical protein
MTLMMRGSMARAQVGLVLVGTVLSLAGCNCSPQQSDCTGYSVRFVSPRNGDAVGTPADVEVWGLTDQGTPFQVSSASLQPRQSSADVGAALTGTVSDGGTDVVFGGATLPVGSTDVEVSLNVANTSCAAVKGTITVTVSNSTATPALVSQTLPQDANADGALNLLELPLNTAVQVAVTTQNGSGTTVEVATQSGTVCGTATVLMNAATVSLDPTACPAPTNDVVTYVVRLKQAGTTVDSKPLGITFRREPPTCANTTKLLQGPNDDADMARSGFQLTTTGTVGSTATQVTFSVASGPHCTATPSAGAATCQLDEAGTGDSTYAVVMEAKDLYGNSCLDSKMVEVRLGGLTVAIASPVAPDAGSAPVTTSPLTISATTNAADGATCTFYLTAPGGTEAAAGTGVVASGACSADVSFSRNGSYGLRVEVADGIGNTASATETLAVGLTSCPVGFISPASCPKTLFAADLMAGKYPVTIESVNDGGCVGAAARLLIDGTVRANGPIAANEQFGASLPFAAATDGGSAVYTVRGEVDNVTGAASFAECVVSVDLSTPAITNPATPASGAYVMNVSEDADESTPGAQRVIAFTANVPQGATTSICTTQATDPVTSAARPACADGSTGWYLLRTGVSSGATITYPEGTYSVKVVIVAGQSTNVSDPLPLIVKVTRPCVSSLGSPKDTGNPVTAYAGDHVLNAAELASSRKLLQFNVGCGIAANSDFAATSPIAVYAVVGGQVSSGFTASNVVTAFPQVSLDISGLADGATTFFVEVTDLYGNKNVIQASNDPAQLRLTVDQTAPTCSITGPAAATQNIAQSGGALYAVVATSSDVSTNGVSLSVVGPSSSTQSLTPSNGQASATVAVTGDNSWAMNATCTDTAGNATAASAKTVRIDLVAPTCTFTAPTATGYSNKSIPTSLNVTGAEGQTVTVSSSAQVSALGGLTVSSGVATSGTPGLTYPNGLNQTVTANLADDTGNPATCSVVISVASAACNLALTSTYSNGGTNWVNLNNTSAGSGGRTAVITATSSDCHGRTVTLKRTAPSASTIGTATTDASTGNVSFTQTVVDGEQYSVVIDNGAGLTTPQTFTVDMVAPTFTGTTINSIATTAAANIYVVASSGNHNVALGTAGYFVDQNGSALGGQITAGVGQVTGGNGGTFAVKFNGATASTTNITGSPVDLSQAATLTQGQSAGLSFVLTDLAGNAATAYSATATVDVIAPSAPTASFGAASRNGVVLTTWSHVYSDATDSASGAATYEVRWTTSTVGTGNKLATEADYFGTSAAQEPDKAFADSPLQLSLPPLNTVWVAVRAHDAVGNYSAYSAPSAGGISTAWTEIQLTDGQGGVSSFGETVRGDVDLTGDGKVDLVVTAPDDGDFGGYVYVFKGGTSFAAQSTCTAGSCQRFTAPDQSPTRFGEVISVDGDVDHDGIADLLVGDRGWNGLGRVTLYFGGATIATSTATTVSFVGDAANTLYGSSVRILKDLNGDGYDEVAIVTPSYDPTASNTSNQNLGRIYIFKGRANAAWVALGQSVPTSAATWTITGPSLGMTRARYGNNQSFIGVGDITGDSKADFIIANSQENVGQMQAWSGSTVGAATGALTSASALSSGLADPITGTSNIGFGYCAVAATNLLSHGAGSAIDVAIGLPSLSLIYFYNTTSSGFGAGSSTVVHGKSGTGFGSGLAAGDLNGDGKPDLVVGEVTSTLSSWVVFQSSTGFESGASSPAFWQAELPPADAAASIQGFTNSIGDVNADTYPDVITGDSGLGIVRVWK